MVDYIKRSNAINALKGLPTWWADQGGIYGNAQPPMEAMLDPEDTISAIENIPSADVVEVVRCKDCRHRDPEDHKCDCGQLERAGCVFPVNDDYFCAYGERRDGT